jgi:putative acetyltransferase
LVQSISTERLLLRRFEPDDLEDVFAYAKNPNVGPAAGWRPHENIGDSLFVLRRFMEADLVWAVVEKASRRVMGSISLQPDRTRTIESVRKLGYSIGEEFWGKGYMTEAAKAVVSYAFLCLGLEVVSVDHYPENARSKRVIEKCGFVYEGTLRDAVRLYDGTTRDLCCYSITRQEFLLGKGAAPARRIKWG